jgi:hypothetical protein
MTHPLLLLALIFATSLLAFVPTFGGVFLLAVHDARTATILRPAPAAAPSPVDSESNSPGEHASAVRSHEAALTGGRA